MLVIPVSLSSKKECFIGKPRRRLPLHIAAFFWVGALPALGQPKTCLAHGVLAYSDRTDPRTVSLSLNINPRLTLLATFVPTLDETHAAKTLHVTFHIRTSPNKALKIVTKDDWFGPDEARFDPVAYAMNNEDAPETEEIRLPDIGLGVRLEMGNYEVQDGHFQFVSLQLDVCVHP